MTTDAVASVSRQAALCQALLALPPHDALGVVLAYLLYAADAQPELLRVALSEPVVRVGFRGESLWRVLARVTRSC